MTATEEIARDLIRQIAKMEFEAVDECRKRERECEDWCAFRMRRFREESATLRAKYDSVIKMLADAEARKPMKPVVIVTDGTGMPFRGQ